MTIHLRPTAPIAPDALLPGDPGRALTLAQELLEAPKMSNHHRGLWGYFGETKAGGRPLTIQATGIGGPSAAIVLSELGELGVRRAIRVGTCAALGDELAVGSVAIVEAALATDGTSRALGAEGVAEPAPALLAALRDAAPAAASIRVETADLFYPPAGAALPIAVDGAQAREMETAPLFALGRALGVEVGCLLTVVAGSGAERIGEERLVEAELEMGRVAAVALAAPSTAAGQLAAEPSTSSRE